jgi:NTE family protein
MKSLDKIIRSVQAFRREFSRPQAIADPGPAIGIALGGGFACGIAHVGVLKVLEEEGIPFRFVAGTSVGALIGAAYCSGLSIPELEEVVYKSRFTTFARWTLSRYGFATSDRMVSFLSRTLKVQTFEELRIPLGIAATDFNSGEGVVFRSGPCESGLPHAWRANEQASFGRFLLERPLFHPRLEGFHSLLIA